MEGQDLASTYVLCPRPRTGCPDFGMDQKDVMGWSVMEQGVTEQRCDGPESRVLGQMSAEAHQQNVGILVWPGKLDNVCLRWPGQI